VTGLGLLPFLVGRITKVIRRIYESKDGLLKVRGGININYKNDCYECQEGLPQMTGRSNTSDKITLNNRK